MILYTDPLLDCWLLFGNSAMPTVYDRGRVVVEIVSESRRSVNMVMEKKMGGFVLTDAALGF